MRVEWIDNLDPTTSFADPVVAAAMLDRLMHRSIIVPIDGDSYRIRTHRNHTHDLRKAITLGD